MAPLVTAIAGYLVELGASQVVATLVADVVVAIATTELLTAGEETLDSADASALAGNFLEVAGHRVATFVSPCRDRSDAKPLPPGMHFFRSMTADMKLAHSLTNASCLSPEIPPGTLAFVDTASGAEDGDLVVLRLRDGDRLASGSPYLVKQLAVVDGQRLLLSNLPAFEFSPERYDEVGRIIAVIVTQAADPSPEASAAADAESGHLVELVQAAFVERGLSITGHALQFRCPLPLADDAESISRLRDLLNRCDIPRLGRLIAGERPATRRMRVRSFVFSST